MRSSILLDHSWRLVEISDASLTDTELKRAKADIHFEEGGKVFGHGGCNRFFGNYELFDDGIKFGALASTRMYCVETMAVEDSYFSALDKIEHWSVTGDELLLRSEHGDTWLKFKRSDGVDERNSFAAAMRKSVRNAKKGGVKPPAR